MDSTRRARYPHPMYNLYSLTKGLYAWIVVQPEPRPSRPKAIRRLVEKALAK
jgi:hypothetical protein